MLQQVLFKHYCKDQPSNHHNRQRKYRNNLKLQPDAAILGLPPYVLQKFRNDKFSAGKEKSSKNVVGQNANSQIFVQRNKMSKHRQSLSPLRTHKNLREYSNLLFAKRNQPEIKLPTNTHLQIPNDKNNHKQYSTLTLYHDRSQDKFSKEIQQESSTELQAGHFPSIGKSTTRRTQYIQTLRLQHLTSANMGFWYGSKDRHFQLAEQKALQAMQICGWQDGELLQ